MNILKNIVIISGFLLIALDGLAQKTDTVTFYNGDRAICEIKGLNQGRLEIKTVAMGTINVEWRKVSNVVTNRYYEIVLANHSTIYGKIVSVDSARNVTLSFGVFAQEVPILEIVKLKPLNDKFWQALEGSISAGFSYTRGTENLQLNSSGSVKYRTPKTAHSISINGNFSANPSTRSEKQEGGYRFQLFYVRQVFNALEVKWERNTELGIDSRLITNITGGYSPVENYINVLSIEVGGSINREFTTENVASNNAEGLVRLSYDLFVFANPKIFFTLKGEAFPSFTVKNRFRTNIESTLSWEIFNNFTLNFSYWANYDNKPSDPAALTFDWGTTTSIGYKF